MDGRRLSRLAVLPVFLLALSLPAFAEMPATGSTTTSTYKSTTIERVTTVQEEVKVVQPPKKEKLTCAVVIKNRASRVPDEKVGVLQDFVNARLTDAGFILISQEIVANAVSHSANAGTNNTSTLQLARNMGADCILSVAISSYGADTISYNGFNVNVTGTRYRLKVSYELLDAYRGGSMTGGVITTSFSERQQEGLRTSRETVIDDLLDAAAVDLSNMLAATMNSGALAEAVAVAKADPNHPVNFKVSATVANLSIPQVRKDDKGPYVMTDTWQPVAAPSANVELDGVTVGNTGTPLQAPSGLHKLRIRHEMFNDWEGTVYVREGQELSLAMQLSPAGLAQFKEMTSFFQDLRPDQAIPDATAEKIKGYARTLEQSGFKVDVKATTLPAANVNDKVN